MTPGASELPAAPDWDALAADFEAFHARFASLFVRSEPREQAIKYVRALMGAAARRYGWQLAEAIGDRTPDRVKRLLYWGHEAALAAPREKSPPPPKGATARRRWLPGAFRKSAA